MLVKHESFINSYKGKTALIIGGGNSVSALQKPREWADVVLVLNTANKYFERDSDFHLVLEDAPLSIIERMQTGTPRLDLPRLVSPNTKNWPAKLCLLPTERLPGAKYWDLTKWSGALPSSIGPLKVVSSVLLQAIHWAALLGCTTIKLIGCELRWRDQFKDHFYGDDSAYRTEGNKLNFNTGQCYETLLPGDWRTLDIFQFTADYINQAIKEIYRPNQIRIIDYSEGLITEAERGTPGNARI